METVELGDLLQGAVLEVLEVATIPNPWGTQPRAFLCMDMQMRFVTLEGGCKFLGGASNAVLCSTLVALGFEPHFLAERHPYRI